MEEQHDELIPTPADIVFMQLSETDKKHYFGPNNTPESMGVRAWVETEMMKAYPEPAATPDFPEWNEEDFNQSLADEGLNPNNAQEFVAAMQQRGYSRGIAALSRISQLEASDAYRSSRHPEHERAILECLNEREILQAEKDRWMASRKKK